MENLLSGTNIRKEYLEFSLHNVNIQVPKGTIVGFVGKNGAGKTTTIKAILDLIKKDNGEIVFSNEYISEKNTHLFEKIGVVFDECAFPKLMNATQLGQMMRMVYKRWSTQKYNQLLDRMEIPKNRKIKDLSRGMGMKLSLVVALSHNPDLLVLDEPTSGLDPVVRDEVLDLFLEFVQDENKSILFSSHITTDLEKIADYIVFIKDGEIILNKEKDQLLYDYALIRCYDEEMENIDMEDIIAIKKEELYNTLLVCNKEMIEKKYANLIIDDCNIEEIMLILNKGKINKKYDRK